ncbi:hypothetical protein IAT38_003358 [Cryptococcus sp. DSM 104549]
MCTLNSLIISQLPSSLVSGLCSWLSNLPSSDSVLPFIPKSVKLLLVALLIILNSSSFPFLWHIRVFYHLIRLNAIQRYKGRRKYLTEWKADIDASGGLRGVRVTDKRRAWFDDCDYNMHLSKSCYSKNSDPVKLKYAIDAFRPRLRLGIIHGPRHHASGGVGKRQKTTDVGSAVEVGRGKDQGGTDQDLENGGEAVETTQ